MNEETLAALRVACGAARELHDHASRMSPDRSSTRCRGDMMESAKLPALGYTSALEALAEKFHSSPALLRTLNPGATWAAGEAIKVPDVEPFELPGEARGANPLRRKPAAAV